MRIKSKYHLGSASLVLMSPIPIPIRDNRQSRTGPFFSDFHSNSFHPIASDSFKAFSLEKATVADCVLPVLRFSRISRIGLKYSPRPTCPLRILSTIQNFCGKNDANLGQSANAPMVKKIFSPDIIVTLCLEKMAPRKRDPVSIVKVLTIA